MSFQTLQLLYDEHDVIVRAIGRLRQAANLAGDRYEPEVRNLIHFFRTYADRYHHFKEEEILFPEMARKSALLDEGILREMFSHHAAFRERIASAERHLDAKEYAAAQAELEAYAGELTDHIAVENEEVFPMAESLLSAAELELIAFRFDDCDRELGREEKENALSLPGVPKTGL